MQILKGVKAKKQLKRCLTGWNPRTCEYPEKSLGYFQESDGTYTAFDNRTGHCNVEEFNTERKALNWLK